jgi:lysozyme
MRRIATSYNDVSLAAAELIKGFESFRSSPYWDVTRYSWGYGTPAPGRTGYINKQDAERELQGYNIDNYNYLSTLISVPLTINQWAALLSFAYNLGQGNADNLVKNINSQDWEALGIQWNQYINAGGVPLQDLIDRRAAEWQLFVS